MNEKQVAFLIPFVLIIFGSVFAIMANYPSNKLGGRLFTLSDLYTPAVFVISGAWSTVLIAKSPHRTEMKILLILLAFFGVALSGFALFEQLH